MEPNKEGWRAVESRREGGNSHGGVVVDGWERGGGEKSAISVGARVLRFARLGSWLREKKRREKEKAKDREGEREREIKKTKCWSGSRSSSSTPPEGDSRALQYVEFLISALVEACYVNQWA